MTDIMTDETTESETPETTIETPEVESSGDDMVDAVTSGFAALNTEPEEADPILADPDEVPEVETPESDEDEEETPLPKGRRAKQEYEARIAAERENAALKAQIDSLKADQDKLMEAFNGNKAPEDKDAVRDAYLREKGIDPDAFIDDAAKDGQYTVLKEIDDLKAGVSQTKQNADTASYRNSVSTIKAQLEPAVIADVNAAESYVIQNEARQIMLNAQNAGQQIEPQAALNQAKQVVDQAMFSRHQQGINPLQWMYQYAQANNYQSTQAAESAPTTQLNPERIKESQKRAGAPAIDVAATKDAAPTGFQSAAYRKFQSELR